MIKLIDIILLIIFLYALIEICFKIFSKLFTIKDFTSNVEVFESFNIATGEKYSGYKVYIYYQGDWISKGGEFDTLEEAKEYELFLSESRNRSQKVPT